MSDGITDMHREEERKAAERGQDTGDVYCVNKGEQGDMNYYNEFDHKAAVFIEEFLNEINTKELI